MNLHVSKAIKYLKKPRLELRAKFLRKNIKAVLFDMDGVIIESSYIWWKSFDRTLKKFGSSGISKKDFLEKYWGDSVEDNIASLRKDLKNSNLGLDAIKYCKSQFSILSKKSRLYPNAKPTLKKVSEKFKTALVTNTPRREVFEILKKFDMENYFDAVISIDDVSRGKPDPEPVKKACKILRIKPERAVMIGDTDSDIISGRGAGCRVIGMRISADERIEKISDLLKKLGLKD